jgi:integrase
MRKFLDIKEIKDLLDLSEDHPRDFALFHLAVNTGLRISDLLNLKRAPIMEDGGIVAVLRIKTKKTKAWVDHPLRNDCRDAVARYLVTRVDANPYLFPSESNNSLKRNKPMSRQSAHRTYKGYLEMMFPASVLAGASTHTLRRSMAKIIANKVGRAEAAGKFLGHKSLASTLNYIDYDSWGQKADDVVLNCELSNR